MLSLILNRKLSSILALMLLGLILPCQTFGQVDTGAISGTVKDTSGGTVAGARVTLINVETGVSVTTTTSPIGEYSFSPVKIGHYSLSAEFKGFEKVQQNNVTVDVQQKVLVDIALPPGQPQEVVVVNAAPPALQTQDASVG